MKNEARDGAFLGTLDEARRRRDYWLEEEIERFRAEMQRFGARSFLYGLLTGIAAGVCGAFGWGLVR